MKSQQETVMSRRKSATLHQFKESYIEKKKKKKQTLGIRKEYKKKKKEQMMIQMLERGKELEWPMQYNIWIVQPTQLILSRRGMKGVSTQL